MNRKAGKFGQRRCAFPNFPAFLFISCGRCRSRHFAAATLASCAFAASCTTLSSSGMETGLSR